MGNFRMARYPSLAESNLQILSKADSGAHFPEPEQESPYDFEALLFRGERLVSLASGHLRHI